MKNMFCWLLVINVKYKLDRNDVQNLQSDITGRGNKEKKNDISWLRSELGDDLVSGTSHSVIKALWSLSALQFQIIRTTFKLRMSWDDRETLQQHCSFIKSPEWWPLGLCSPYITLSLSYFFSCAADVYAYVGHAACDGVTLTISLCVIKPVVTRKQCVSYQVNECSAK